MEASERAARLEQVKRTASRLMHAHYCDNDVESVISTFAPAFSWIGAGEEQYVVGREEAAAFFRRFRGVVAKCDIRDEHYDVVEAGPGVYLCSGRMWVATAPETGMYIRAHQRVSFLFRWQDGAPLCCHIHCSNPYMELAEGELFPEKLGRHSYEYVQERLRQLEAEADQKNRQMEVVLSSITGGLKISRDDDTYSFAYVSEEAAALFGYTVEEFMQVTGGTAVGTVYPPDLAGALRDCDEAFRDGGLTYATKYRVRCKDGSLKWVLDSGKKCMDADGNWMVNSLYLDITRSEEDSRKIVEQKELLNSIYDTIPCGILRFVREGGRYEVVSMNRAALELLGYETAEQCRRDWHNGTAGTVLDEDRHVLMDSYAHLERVGDRRDVEYRVRWRDGSLHWLSGSNMIASQADGRDVIQRMMFDVTESRRLREQLDREQEMYRVAMESSADVVYEYRMDEDCFTSYAPTRDGAGREQIYRNELPQYQRLLHTRDIIHRDDIPMVIDNICNGRCEVFEARLRWPELPPEAGYRWHRITGRLISRDGRPSRVVGTIRNIHDMKQTLSANTEELHMIQSALQAISGVYVSIYYVDLQEGQYYAVRVPEYSSGLTIPRRGALQETLGAYISSYVSDQDQARVRGFCDLEHLQVCLREVNDQAEIEFIHKMGKRVGSWLRLEVRLISQKGGKPKNAIFTFRNVTQERRRELEHQQEEEKAKRALEEAYEAANRANLAKSDFLSRMSHDIRTPMNAILGMAAIAEQNLGVPAKVEDCLEKIRLSGGHLLELINEVLDMSKIESGSVSLNEDTFRIQDMLGSVSEMIRPDAVGRGQHLCIEADALEHGAVCGDLVRVRQILLNLLTNAVKYTPEGGHIRLCAQEKLSSTGGVGCFEFVVEDDGIGIPEAFLEKLFQPFERAEDARVSRIQGTGLGMAITQNLVRMMNGAIRVESRLDRGTRFTVTLYLKLADREELRSCAPEDDGGDFSFTRPWRILLVEDNALNREIARELLHMSGLLVEEAENGRVALERFRASAPGELDLILMDIQMPEMDGYQATQAIRALDRPDAGTIPIVALTANAFADDEYRAKQAGMNEHVTKPLELARLRQVLRRWLEGREMG